MDLSDYRSKLKPTWCKGCSFYGILSAITQVLYNKQVDPKNTCVISGIGCSSRISLYFNTFGMHTLHGRAIPVAVGSRLTRPDIPVIVTAGDGDLFSIGIGHFVHAARKNFNLTVICMNNRIYAMTKNQASPTSAQGYPGTLTPYGKISVPLNVIEFAISCEATFVSRTFCGNQEHMIRTISSAYEHNGFAFVEIIAPCRTFSKENTISQLSTRMIDINENLSHNPYDKNSALTRASHAIDYDQDTSVEIPIGIFWHKNTDTFEENAHYIKNKKTNKEITNTIFEKYKVC